MGFFDTLGDMAKSATKQNDEARSLSYVFESCDDDELIQILKGKLSPYSTYAFMRYEDEHECDGSYTRPDPTTGRMAVQIVAKSRGLIK